MLSFVIMAADPRAPNSSPHAHGRGLVRDGSTKGSADHSSANAHTSVQVSFCTDPAMTANIGLRAMNAVPRMITAGRFGMLRTRIPPISRVSATVPATPKRRTARNAASASPASSTTTPAIA